MAGTKQADRYTYLTPAGLIACAAYSSARQAGTNEAYYLRSVYHWSMDKDPISHGQYERKPARAQRKTQTRTTINAGGKIIDIQTRIARQ